MTGASFRLVVVGRDVAFWLAVTTLHRALSATGVSVTAIELPTELDAGAICVGLAPLEALHNRLGLEEANLVGATAGGFSLGWNIVPPAPGAPFFLAHGSYGAPIDEAAFFPYWVKARRFGLDTTLEAFCPTAMAARHGRLLLPDAETEAFGRTGYGYHLPALAYAALLKGMAYRAGVEIRQARSVAVARDGQSGAIRTVRTDQGVEIEGDLFIDASGSEALLAGAPLGQPFSSCRAGFVADRMLLAHAPRFASVPVYTEVRVECGGWLALHAAQAATHIRYVFSSEHLGDEAALAAAGAVGALPAAARIERLDPGQRARPWTANCIAIGAAAYRLDPVFDLDLHVVQLGLVHLLSLFPVGDAFAAERDEYNRILDSTVARLRDLQSAFYALGRYGEAGFWAATRQAEIPATVRSKIETFRARGEIPPMEDETFAADFWQALFVGMGEMPKTWPPAIDLTPPDQMKQGFRRILGFVKDKVLQQPTHDAYLARLGASKVA